MKPNGHKSLSGRSQYSVLSTEYSVQRIAPSCGRLPAGAWIATLLYIGVFTGCRGGAYQMAEVRGKVTTCEGKPAAGGQVVFYPVDAPDQTGRPAGNPGREARGTVAEDGTFTLTTIGISPTPGAVTGPHKVSFEMPPARRPTLSAEDRSNMTPEEIKQVEADFASRPLYPPIPCSDQIQPAEVTVQPGKNEFQFTLPPK